MYTILFMPLDHLFPGLTCRLEFDGQGWKLFNGHGEQVPCQFGFDDSKMMMIVESELGEEPGLVPRHQVGPIEVLFSDSAWDKLTELGKSWRDKPPML